MKYEEFIPKMGQEWAELLKPFLESEEMTKIFSYLKARFNGGHKIAPKSNQTFRAFLETPPSKIVAVMMGMCPYHSLRNDKIVADGLLMGCSNTKIIQPSLQKYYDGVEKELYDGLELNASLEPDVSYLAKQGVFMFNAALTTEIGKAGFHNKLWQPFTAYVMEKVIAVSGAPVIFLGKDAAVFQKYLAPMQWSFVLTHPASAAYKDIPWDTNNGNIPIPKKYSRLPKESEPIKGVFGAVKKIVKERSGQLIYWLDELPF